MARSNGEWTARDGGLGLAGVLASFVNLVRERRLALALLTALRVQSITLRRCDQRTVTTFAALAAQLLGISHVTPT